MEFLLQSLDTTLIGYLFLNVNVVHRLRLWEILKDVSNLLLS
jgi:hypothetical protein